MIHAHCQGVITGDAACGTAIPPRTTGVSALSHCLHTTEDVHARSQEHTIGRDHVGTSTPMLSIARAGTALGKGHFARLVDRDRVDADALGGRGHEGEGAEYVGVDGEGSHCGLDTGFFALVVGAHGGRLSGGSRHPAGLSIVPSLFTIGIARGNKRVIEGNYPEIASMLHSADLQERTPPLR